MSNRSLITRWQLFLSHPFLPCLCCWMLLLCFKKVILKNPHTETALSGTPIDVNFCSHSDHLHRAKLHCESEEQREMKLDGFQFLSHLVWLQFSQYVSGGNNGFLSVKVKRRFKNFPDLKMFSFCILCWKWKAFFDGKGNSSFYSNVEAFFQRKAT